MKLHGTFHKAVVKKILPLTDPLMYVCVHSTTSRYSGQVQAALETEMVPSCGTYKFFKRSREVLKQLAQDLSQSWLRPASAERRQKRCSKLFAQRKTSVFCLTGKHTTAATTAHKRGARRSRTLLSLILFMLRTRLVDETSAKVVDGICVMFADRTVQYSHSLCVSEYSRHFYVCNTICGSFLCLVGKTGNKHTHVVAGRRTNTLPVENRRRIDAR